MQSFIYLKPLIVSSKLSTPDIYEIEVLIQSLFALNNVFLAYSNEMFDFTFYFII